MKKVSLLAMIFVLFQISNIAQEKKIFDRDLVLGKRTPVFISYYGNMAVYPGFRAGINWNLFMIEKNIEKKKKIKKIRKLLYLAPSILYYNHPDSYQNLMLRVDAGWRRYTKKLCFYDLNLGIGYVQRFNAGETWEVYEDGSATDKGSASRAYFATTFSFAFGKHISFKNGTDMSPFFKIDTDYLFGYNAAFVPELSFELGFIYTPQWGFKQREINIKSKSKIKKKANNTSIN